MPKNVTINELATMIAQEFNTTREHTGRGSGATVCMWIVSRTSCDSTV